MITVRNMIRLKNHASLSLLFCLVSAGLFSACIPAETPHPKANLELRPVETIEAGKPVEMVFSFMDSKGRPTSGS